MSGFGRTTCDGGSAAGSRRSSDATSWGRAARVTVTWDVQKPQLATKPRFSNSVTETSVGEPPAAGCAGPASASAAASTATTTPAASRFSGVERMPLRRWRTPFGSSLHVETPGPIALSLPLTRLVLEPLGAGRTRRARRDARRLAAERRVDQLDQALLGELAVLVL